MITISLLKGVGDSPCPERGPGARARGCPVDPRRPAGGPDSVYRRVWGAARVLGPREPADGSADHAVAQGWAAAGAGSGEDARTAARDDREARWKYDKRNTGYSSSRNRKE